MDFTVFGSAATKCDRLKGLYRRTFRTPTFSPFATRWSVTSSAASAPFPIITMTRSASGAPT